MTSGQAALALPDAEMNCAWCAVEGALDEAGFCDECRVGVIGLAPREDGDDDLVDGVQWSVELFPAGPEGEIEGCAKRSQGTVSPLVQAR